MGVTMVGFTFDALSIFFRAKLFEYFFLYSPVIDGFLSQRVSNVENVSIWRRHHTNDQANIIECLAMRNRN